MAYVDPLAEGVYIRDMVRAALDYGTKNRRVMYARAAGESRIDGVSNKSYTNTLKRLGFEEMGPNCIYFVNGRQDIWDFQHQKYKDPQKQTEPHKPPL
jgi:hypothetical protein